MRCPFCGCVDTQVKDSRAAEDGSTIKRRRQCPECSERFTTFEYVQLRELNVIKKDASIRAFDRDKILRSMRVATRKRPVTEEQIEQACNRVVRALESGTKGDSIPVEMIGEAVMEELAALDKVAYIRFASVYKDFREAKDFEKFVDKITSDVEV